MTYHFSDKIANLKPSAIREILKAPKDADTITLAAGNPAPETFPVADLARFAADIFANDSTTALQYGATDGYEPLRRAVAEDPCIADIGILISTDPIAIDQACVDLVYACSDPGKPHLIERIESRNGVHTIEAAAQLGFGSREYELITV